jgi:hypothetical protein
MNLALSHEGLNPPPRTPLSQRRVIQSTFAKSTPALAALALCALLTGSAHTYAADSEHGPLLTALQGTPPSTEISFEIPTGAPTADALHIDSNRLARATALKPAAKVLAPATLFSAPAPKAVRIVTKVVTAKGVAH